MAEADQGGEEGSEVILSQAGRDLVGQAKNPVQLEGILPIIIY